MTIQEMHYRFKLYLDKLDTASMPNLTHREIDVFLNKAQEELIKVKYGGNNQARTGVEEVEKRREDLANITSSYTINFSSQPTFINNKPNGKFVPLPSDFMFALGEEVTIDVDEFGQKLVGKTRRVNLKPISHDMYNQIVKDPFNKPDPSVCLKLTYEKDQVEIITGDGILAKNYYLRYIRMPLQMDYTNNVSCELFDQIHEEVLDRAVSLALEGIESQRFATQSINSLKNE